MEGATDYLYRGTTEGWPGNETLRRQGITCTTTDPLVATLFALECAFRGAAVVLMAPRSPLERFRGPANHFADLKCAINLTLSPSEFARQSKHQLSARDARGILVSMGFDRIPYLIYGRNNLDEALEITRRESYRLSRDQIREFDRRAFEVLP